MTSGPRGRSAAGRKRRSGRHPRRGQGFTFLEIMLVLALIAIIFLGMVPLVTASTTERQLRGEAEKIQEMVRAERSKALATADRRVVEVRSSGFYEKSEKERELLGMPRETRVTFRAPGENWEKAGGQEWEFSPIGLVTPMSVRLQAGDAWMELDFDLLTGRLAEERYAF